MRSRLTACYRIRSDASAIEERARAIAIEQSVEMPLAAVREAAIRADIVGEVEAIADRGDGWFDVDVALATATVGGDAGQLLNMLFGNSSLHDDVVLRDARLPAQALAELAFEFALGGLDFIKDDHGLADQAYSPFAARLRACAAAVRRAAAITGRPTRYIPSLCGHFGQIERQLAVARAEGIDTVMIAPALAGAATLQGLAAGHPDFAFVTHPTMTGARVSPVLYARLFRLFGADGAIFPNFGGRFGYSAQTCAAIAGGLREPWGDLAASVPAPAGGMTLQRVPELLRFYGKDAMLLIGGALLSAPRDKLAAETAGFVRAVADHDYEA